MGEKDDSLALIDPSGSVRPMGDTALLRLQARGGSYLVLPAPAHIVFMRHAIDGTEPDNRGVLLAGEIRAPGTLCDILSFVGHASYKGELLALDGRSARSVYFDGGYVVGAHSSVPSERLGQVLHRHGVLTEEQAQRCAEDAAANSMRFGEAVVKAGLATREKLFELMGRQIEEIFYGVVLVGSGTFYFLDGFDEAALWVRQKLGVSNLVREGVRRMHETRFFRTRIPSEQHVPARAPGYAPPEQDMLGVYASVDGSRSVAELCRVLGRGEFDVLRALFQLVQSGHVLIRPPRLSPYAAVDVFNKAISLIMRELDAMDQGDVVRQQLVAFSASKEYTRVALKGAGPADDGTLDAARIAENVARASSPGEHEERLAVTLHELASYALFLARPHLRRAQADRPPTTNKPRLSQRIAAIIDPIAPAKEGAAAPPPRPPRPSRP